MEDIDSEIKQHEQEKMVKKEELESLKRTADDSDTVDGWRKHTRSIQRALHSLPDIEKKHLIWLLISPSIKLMQGNINKYPLVLRYETLVDVLDDSDLRKNNLNHDQRTDNPIPLVDYDFKVHAQKVLGAFNYLKNKGYLPLKLNQTGSKYF